MVTELDSTDPRASVAPLRNEPVQARSTARLAALLNAAAGAVDEFGYERLTTAMVAQRAGASIGTVYRYFPDRIAVLQALGARNLDRVLTQISTAVRDPQQTEWSSAVSAGFDVIVQAFRDEPSFRSLRVGDVLDLKPREVTQTYNSLVAQAIFEGVAERFAVSRTPEGQLACEISVEIFDALANRAFIFQPQGDNAILRIAHDTVAEYVAPHFGGSPS
ncbi:MAG: TetR/AcrR family transcriptional regulator [Microbacteriaceae bacterium]